MYENDFKTLHYDCHSSGLSYSSVTAQIFKCCRLLRNLARSVLIGTSCLTKINLYVAAMNVLQGMLSARGRKMLFADADGASTFSDVSKLEEVLEKINSVKVRIGERQTTH